MGFMTHRNFVLSSESDLLHLKSLFESNAQVIEGSEVWLLADINDDRGPLGEFSVSNDGSSGGHITVFFVENNAETLDVIQRSNETGADGAFERRVNLLWDAQSESSWPDEWIEERDRFLALVRSDEPIWSAINAWGEGMIRQFTPEGVSEIYGLWQRFSEIVKIDAGTDLSDCDALDDLLLEWHRYRPMG